MHGVSFYRKKNNFKTALLIHDMACLMSTQIIIENSACIAVNNNILTFLTSPSPFRKNKYRAGIKYLK